MTDYPPKYPVSRETLYDLAWSQPMTSIGKIFDVSSSYLARVYTRLNVPRPSPGYWAKVAVGKPMSKPSLPDPGPNDLLEWDRYNDTPLYSRPAPQPPKHKPARISAPKLGRPDSHPLIRGAKTHFLKTRDSRIGYLRPYKYNLVDLIISKNHLDAALKAVSDLFLAVEEYGYEVRLSVPDEFRYNRPTVDEREKPDKGNRYDQHWSPGRKTVAFIGPIAFGLTIFEYSESLECIYEGGKKTPINQLTKRNRSYSQWTTTHDFPTGRFCLRAYSPYQGTNWTYQWDFKPEQDMTRLGQKVAKELAEHTKTIARLVKEAKEKAEKERKGWEEQRRKWEGEEKVRKQAAALQKSHQSLLQLIEKWEEIRRIESFFDEIELAAVSLPQNQGSNVLDRIVLAREMIGKADALKSFLEWQTPEEILESQSSSLSW